MRSFKTFKLTTVGMKPQSESSGISMEKAANSMRHFTEFKTTTVGRKPQSEGGGKEKRAYDYEHEADELHEHHDARSQRTPLDPKEEARSGRHIGAIFGGPIGALGGGAMGASAGGLKGALVGAALGGLSVGLMGAGLGHLAGIQTAMASKLGIQESKRIMAMPPDKRRTYLKALARQNEITEREAEEWSRHEEAQQREDDRHQERMDADERRHQRYGGY